MPLSRCRGSLRTSVLITSLLLAGVAALPAQAAQASVVHAAQAQKQLAKIAAAFHAARCKFDPLLFATANGDSRYNDQLGLAISPTVRGQQFTLYRQMQKQLMALRREQLGNQDQLTFDLLTYELNNAMQMESFPDHLLPINQMDNVPSTLANYAGGTGSQPLDTVKQYRDYLSRLNQLPAWIDQAIANMRQGMRGGVVQPKTIIAAMLPQLQNLRSATPESSVFYSPVTRLPKSFSAADKKKLTADYLKTVDGKIAPALTRLVGFLENEYLPAGRATPGWSALPNGAAWYAAHIKDSTNLPLSPEEVHALGLKEVARIQQQMAALAPKLGYDGPEKQLPQWVGAQTKYNIFTSDEQVLDAYRAIYAQVQAKLPTYFSLVPKAKLELHLEPELTRATASDHYTPSAADGSHPGVFWPVVNDPKKYSRVDMVSLFLHEGVPGHHLHAALLKELPLPDFRKFSTENPNSAAYTEGWALYSETLWKELGVESDPYQRMGGLNDEMLRAMRLVVDSGIHAKGWTRDQAIDYMLANSPMSRTDATAEVERYIAIPGQALAYKIGQLTISRTKAKAQAALGAKFDPRDFHAQVLDTGSLPMPVLERKIDAWIAAGGGVAK